MRTFLLKHFRGWPWTWLCGLLLLVATHTRAQYLSSSYVQRRDTLVQEQLSELTTRWTVNKHTRLFRFHFRNEIWTPVEKYTLWRTGPTSQVWTLPQAFRLWLTDEGLAVWQYEAQANDWLRQGFAPRFALNDSITLYRINDTLCLSQEQGHTQVWNVQPNVVYWEKEIMGNYDTWQLNDTTSFWKVDSLQHLQLYQDSSQLWLLDLAPSRLEVSQHTSIWTLLPNLEVWKAGKKVNLWSQDARRNWRTNDSIPYFQKVNGQKLWLVNRDIKVLAINDSVQIWRRQPTRKVWNLSPTQRLWYYEPPPPPAKELPPVAEEKPKENTERVRLLPYSRGRNGWLLNDSTQLWQLEQSTELWRLLPAVQRWEVDDTTSLFTVSEQFQITRLGNEYRFWHMEPGAREWTEITKPRYWQRSDTTHTWWPQPELAVTVEAQKLKVWRVADNLRMAPRPEKRRWAPNDSSQIWQLNDTCQLHYQGTQHPGHLWRRTRYVRLPLSDSLALWRLDARTRLSRHGDSLSLWRLRDTWQPDTLPSYRLADTLRVWQLHDSLQIWQSPNQTRFWRRDPHSEVFRLRDTLRAYSYPRPPSAAATEKASNWRSSGHLKLNTHQNLLRNWVQGGESYVALQSEARFDLAYEQEILRWQSWVEMKYGINIRGENAVQKNEDKIEIDSRLHYKQKTAPWTYTTHTNLKTQFTEGRDYSKNLKVSDFMAPLFFNLGLGVAYEREKFYNIYLSPLTIKLIYVADTATVDQTKFGVSANSRSQNQTGAYLNANLTINIAKNIRLENRITLFSNYFRNPQNIDVDWFLQLLMSINRYITAELTLKLLYDDETKIPIYQDLNAQRTKVGEGPRVQMQEVLNVGFMYRF